MKKYILALALLLPIAAVLLWDRGDSSERKPKEIEVGASLQEVKPLATVARPKVTVRPSATPKAPEETLAINTTADAQEPWFAVLGVYEGSSYRTRMAALRQLDAAPSGETIARLLGFLESPNELQDMNSSALSAFYDAVMIYLDKLNSYPEGYAETLASVISDLQQSYVFRDYAVQHLSLLPQNHSEIISASIVGTLWAATTQTDSTVGGTSLRALNRLSSELSTEDNERLRKTVNQWLKDDQVHDAARVSALQVGTELKEPFVLEAAQNILKAEQAQSTVLRISSIHAIGQLGDASMLPLLGKHNSGILATAAQKATQSIEARSTNSLVSHNVP